MTTVAYRDGVLASDSRECSGKFVDNDLTKKIFTLPDGSVVGYAGTSIYCAQLHERILRAFKNGTSIPDGHKGVGALLVTPKGKIWYHELGGWQRIRTKYYATGSGWVAAMSAMDAGADAVSAVRIAISRDPHSGGRVQKLCLST